MLRTMAPVGPGGLYDVCERLKEKGAHGVLISGGCDTKGRVPLGPHLADLRRVSDELGLAVRVHTGLVSDEVAEGLASVSIDGVMLDIIGAQETIKDVYHLDLGVEEYEKSLERLALHGIPAVPHIVLGLHFGKFIGEWDALDIIERHPRKAVVLVILQPLYGTAMAFSPPPPVDEIGEFCELIHRQVCKLFPALYSVLDHPADYSVGLTERHPLLYQVFCQYRSVKKPLFAGRLNIVCPEADALYDNTKELQGGAYRRCHVKDGNLVLLHVPVIREGKCLHKREE